QARIQLEQSRAEGELNKAYAKLNYQLGLPADVAYTLPPLIPQIVVTSGGRDAAFSDRLLATTLDEWLEYVREHHPAIASARAQLAAARAGLHARKSDGLSTVDLNLGHYRNGRPDQTLRTVRS